MALIGSANLFKTYPVYLPRDVVYMSSEMRHDGLMAFYSTRLRIAHHNNLIDWSIAVTWQRCTTMKMTSSKLYSTVQHSLYSLLNLRKYSARFGRIGVWIRNC